ncbi:3D domain-containing protein [uncultured Ruminococcus sp.]|uniref:3D domain-containing protein n=1 Tax=uncultured Ruminococcus sp. TaxID=165186 RepID=UPI0025FA9B88|nr:3D domain-containing protein [uncultured Ruminococcus sp.]
MMLKTFSKPAIKWTVAAILCAAISAGALVNAAANTASADEAAATNKTYVESSTEFEIGNGDVIVGTNKDFNMSFDVIKANTITINNCGEEQTISLAKGTVEEVLNRTGITLAENQSVTPSLNTVITGDMNIYVYNSKNIKLTTNGTEMTVKAPEGTVENALNILGYEITDDDILNVDKNAQIEDDMKITLKKVTYVDEKSTEKISYKTVEKDSDDIMTGESEVSQKGVDGEKEVTKRCKYIDGKYDSTKVIDEKVTKKPVDKIVLNGTKRGTTTDTSGAPVSYSYMVSGSGTAYTAAPGALTATGVPVYEGGVAVNPAIIPYGSKLYIEAADGSHVYGYATAIDTGGALMDGSAIVDLFYFSYDDCVSFGRRDVNVYVL